MADIVAEVLARVIEIAQPITPAMAAEVERAVRQEFGGEDCYVQKLGESGNARRTVRDQQIRAQYRRGEHIRLLARRWHLSEKRIRQIVCDTKREIFPLSDFPPANDDGAWPSKSRPKSRRKSGQAIRSAGGGS